MADRHGARRRVREGRTPREYQDRFTHFLNTGLQALKAASISYRGADRSVVSDQLSTWPEDIADGGAPENATPI